MEENAIVRTLVAQRVKVLGYIQSLVRRRHMAEDIFQDVCVLAVEKRHTIQNEAHLLNLVTHHRPLPGDEYLA